MKRIAYTFLCCSTLLTGCQTADFFTSKLNPTKIIPNSNQDVQSQAEIEENTKQFLAEIKEKSVSQSEEVDQLIHRGQQEIVSWYQDHDDRHISAAKQNFRKALKIQPKGNVDSLHGLAVVADLEKNFQVAEQHYQLALAQSPGDPNILGNLGYSYLLQNRLQESERYLSRATQIDPGNVDAVKHLGEVYAKLGLPGKAQSVLAQVMTPEEARQFVGSQSQLAANESDSSSLGKLTSRKSPENSTVPQMEQFNTVSNEQLDRQSMMQFHNSAVGYQYPSHEETRLSEQELKKRLAAIDQERNRNLNGGPVVIHSNQSNQRDTAPGSGMNSQQPQMLVNSPSQIPQQSYSSPNQRKMDFQNSFSQPNEYSEMSPYQQQQYAQSQQALRQQSQLEASQYQNQNSQHTTARVQSQKNIVQQVTPPGQQYYDSPQRNEHYQARQQAQVDPLRKPWGGLNGQKAMHVSYEEQQTMEPYPGPQTQGPQTLDNSQIQGAPIDLSQGSRSSLQNQNQHAHYQQRFNQPGRIEQSHIQQAAVHNAPNKPNRESASMQAAKLGMGVGPGNMFAAVDETAPQQQPGMQSTWNGGSFSQPNRMLPTDVPPLDLSQSTSQQPVNSMGQQLNGSTVTNQYNQFGTASRFDAQSQQIVNQHQQTQQNLHRQQLQMDQQLRDQRRHAQTQLNQHTQDVWNQRPLTPHVPSSGGQQLLSPAEHGGMIPMTAQQQNNSVPPYPYSHRSEQESQSKDYPASMQQGNPRQQNSQQNYYYDANSYQNVVEPPPYRSNMNSSNFQSQNGGIQQVGHSEPVRTTSSYPQRSQYPQQSGTNMPMIVPGNP